VSYEMLYKSRVCDTNTFPILSTEKILEIFTGCRLPKWNRIQ